MGYQVMVFVAWFPSGAQASIREGWEVESQPSLTDLDNLHLSLSRVALVVNRTVAECRDNVTL